MKKLLLIITPLLFFSGCMTSNSHPGTYVNRSNSKEYMELYKDSTFFVQEMGFQVHGKYRISEGEITWMFEGGLFGGMATKAQIADGVITESNGKVWVRK